MKAGQPLMKIAVRPAFAALLGAVCLLAVPASATAGPPAGFVDTLVTSGLTRATAMAWDPNGRLFVLEQGGTVRVIKCGKLLPTPFVSLNVDSTNERGLLGITFDPQFTTNHYVYLYYTVPGATSNDPSHNRIS